MSYPRLIFLSVIALQQSASDYLKTYQKRGGEVAFGECIVTSIVARPFTHAVAAG